ncbi:hypothetical protein MLD38_006154 [Melastoma candidum]|uniref:Uncharacterized protein n=1 Tax=Melastoma candidum TaxID=119954 RepID=A0ACB9RLL8_9MYRT|nr:hypothetical protein MLD38_006154 [Melastoma candidum]
MSSVSSREARRRKIKERSSDRLALITGRIQTLPPSVDSSPRSVDVSASKVNKVSTATLLRDNRVGDFNDICVNPSQDNPESPFQKSQTDQECKDEALILQVNDVQKSSLSSPMSQEVSDPVLHEEPRVLERNDDPEPSLSSHLSREVSHPVGHSESLIFERNDDLEPSLSSPSREVSRPVLHSELPISEQNDDLEPSLSSPLSTEVSHPVIHSEPPILELNTDPEPLLTSPVSREVPHPVLPVEPPKSWLQDQLKSFSFSPYELRSAVDHTASARLLCSVLVAVLVILSYIGFPLIGGKVIRSVLMFRPLYLVLLTNITLIVARMILTQQSEIVRSVNGEGKSHLGTGSDWVNQIGNNLELGFLLMKMMDAVIMECSVYSAIVVCGLRLARLFT